MILLAMDFNNQQREKKQMKLISTLFMAVLVAAAVHAADPTTDTDRGEIQTILDRYERCTS